MQCTTENKSTSYLHLVADSQDTEDVSAHILGGGIAMNTGYPKDLHIRHSQSHHDSLGIIHATVYIYKQLLDHGGSKQTALKPDALPESTYTTKAN